MSEKSPEQRKWLTDKCDNCSKTYKISAENSGLMAYLEQPECNYAICTCPSCSYVTRIFVGESAFELLVSQELPLEVEKYADDNVYSDWLEVNNIVLPESHPLTDRLEKTVQQFGQALGAMSTEMFFEGMSSEVDHPYPDRWI